MIFIVYLPSRSSHYSSAKFRGLRKFFVALIPNSRIDKSIGSSPSSAPQKPPNPAESFAGIESWCTIAACITSPLPLQRIRSARPTARMIEAPNV
jgi:hypothetical protein